MWDKDAMLVLTDKCVAECEICYAGCSRNNDRVMSKELLFDALKQIKNLCLPAGDGAKTICFSGGEPFLFYELLKSGVAKAKEMGFSTAAHTNGFWGAETGERISEMLGNLALDYITVSTDFYHNEFIPESSVYNLMKVIKGSNVRCTLRIGETTNASSDDFILKMGAYKYMTNTVIHPFMKIGRAGSMAEGNFFRLIDAKKTKCPSGKSLTIRFDGEVFLCGGPAWTKNSMSFGNIRDSSLSDILNSDRAKKFSAALGQKGVFRKISRITGCSGSVDLPDAPEKCSGACELCLALFSDAKKLAEALNSFDLSNGRPA